MNTEMSGTETTPATAMAATTTAAMSIGTIASSSMTMGNTGGCKLSMLLNWTTINSCFLFPSFHIHTIFTFLLTCLGAFILPLILEFLRRVQRRFDRYLRSKNAFRQSTQYEVPVEEMEEKLLEKQEGSMKILDTKSKRTAVVLEQTARGALHCCQFAVSYCIMLLFMYSNGYVIISILLGAFVGFAMFTRDTLDLNATLEEHEDKVCC